MAGTGRSETKETTIDLLEPQSVEPENVQRTQNKTGSIELSGRSVVLAMFLFGLAATGTLWAYWHYHTAAFRPLQEAIAGEFAQSVPKVDGGQRKMHEGGPRLLRIVMRVDFDPTQDDSRAQQLADRVLELVKEHQDVRQFETLELHLFQGVPEEKIRERTLERPLSPSSVPDSDVANPAD